RPLAPTESVYARGGGPRRQRAHRSRPRFAKLRLAADAASRKERAMKTGRLVSALLAGLAIAAPHVSAQGGAVANFPQRPIRLVVGFPPGGATDILARILSQHMPESIGQSVVV